MSDNHPTKTAEKAVKKTFDKPTETREFPKGRLDLIDVGGRIVGKATLMPGWKWSESLKPIANTRSCEMPHFQYHVSGVICVHMDDGTEFNVHPGEVSMLPPGHDAWVVGNEPVVVIDFQGMEDFAKKMK